MSTNKNKVILDSLGRKTGRIQEFDLPLAKYVTKYKRNSVLFSKSRRTESFFTEDSKLYYTPEEFRRLQRGERIVRLVKRLDNLNSKVFENSKIYATRQSSNFWEAQLQAGYGKFRDFAFDLVQDSKKKITVVRMWNLSIVGAVLFGMFTMTMIYRYLGQGVSAAIQENKQQAQESVANERVLGAVASQEASPEIDMDSITSLLSEQNAKRDLEEEIREMVKGYPIEDMVPLIAKQDRVVAAFLIGIARQESSWGTHVPVYKGQACHNLWGWRGKNAVGSGGHTCFASKEEAVETVAKRIKFLVSNQKLDTPEKMIVWKCGDCSWDKKENMQRWINSVGIYFKKLNTESD